MGLKALGVLGELDKEDVESAPELSLDKFPLERMGRRRKFVFTLLRSCCRAARSLEISSSNRSSSEDATWRVGPMLPIGDDGPEESESES